ncbi:hypothetical protein GCM10007981_06770 [Thermocladium modestius]|uniref:DUF981 family protein n=1 Tax=Thermocladium modestius TaxID=62609 RepID=A0A830GV18_9CREN|nr:DUF981 family protein [Thermocladium modestius]GGP20092.1 hypothetical protein GCM10007981_06770 [Thermocladium modestius]
MPFIDYLTAMMTLSIAVDLAAIYMAYRLSNPIQREDSAGMEEIKSIGLTLLALSLPTLIYGLSMSITWPLPGGYNLLFGDPFAYLGVVALMGGLLLYFSPTKLKAASLPVGFLSLITIVYGASILTHGLTSEPTLAFAFYLFEGLGGISMALLLFKQNKAIAYATMALLAIAAIIILIVDGGAIFQHPALFAKYAP